MDLIIELVRRRAEPSALRGKMLGAACARANTVLNDGTYNLVEVSIAPLYPRRPLCTRDTTWDFLSTQTFRDTRFFPLDTLRRVEDGTASLKRGEQYGQLNTFGVVLARKQMERRKEGELTSLRVGDPLHLILKVLVCAERFYRLVSYRGNVEISLTLRNIRGSRMMFIPNVRFWELDEDDYRCYEDEVLGTHLVASENLRGSLVATAQALISQICWPFWQSPSNFPEETVQKYVEAIVKELGLDVID